MKSRNGTPLEEPNRIQPRSTLVPPPYIPLSHWLICGRIPLSTIHCFLLSKTLSSLIIRSVRCKRFTVMVSVFPCLLLLSFPLAHSYHQSVGSVLDVIRLGMSSGNFDGYRQSDTKRGAYEIASSSEIRMPCIILVNPFLDQNVGSVSRAMVS